MLDQSAAAFRRGVDRADRDYVRAAHGWATTMSEIVMYPSIGLLRAPARPRRLVATRE